MLLPIDKARQICRVDDESNDNQIRHALDGALAYLLDATGYDWDADAEPDKVAKMAASMLLVQWFEHPDGTGSAPALSYGLTNLIKQLQVKALGTASEKGAGEGEEVP